MRHFFPKQTVEAAVWCLHCGHDTPWRISGGRPMYCIPCYERRKAERIAADPPKPADPQMDLFNPERKP